MEEHDDESSATMIMPVNHTKSNTPNKFGSSNYYSPARLLILEGDISLLREDIHILQTEVAELKTQLIAAEKTNAKIKSSTTEFETRLSKLEGMATKCIHINRYRANVRVC
jgi:hypothetical protein